MKLCRFELKSEPGEVRSGFVRAGTVVESDGQTVIAVHEASDIRPLPPVGRPGCLRLTQPDDLKEEESLYAYLNPSSIVGASTLVPYPNISASVDFLPCIGAIVGSDALNIGAEVATDTIIGYTLAIIVVARDLERVEKSRGRGPGASHDIAIAVGPVLTTPDEFEELDITLATQGLINGVETHGGEVGYLPDLFGQFIARASLTAPIRTGDLFLLGPVASPAREEATRLEPGDEVRLAVEKLGTLALKLSVDP